MFLNKLWRNLPFRRTSQERQQAKLDAIVSQRLNTMTLTSEALAAVPKVDIDPEGVFKYILLRVYDPKLKNNDEHITILRGYARCSYHSDIYEEVQIKLEPLDCEPIGGGRISHDPGVKKIHIYGYSQGYGKANHEDSAKLIKEHYPDYTVSISDEGY
ncbi:janus/Ocnus family (Ocnus) domain-containing protein [Phthorimaea operculella]|nr:janus/Ocnus family (Ocnus) domain-containing protein [Phthorimaea operculella]